MGEKKGNIFDIQRFSIGNGPGIRTTVFLKGCPLRCKWCHNPESMSGKPQLMYDKKLCKKCGACAKACPTQGISLSLEDYHIDRMTCTLCGVCVSACNYGALSVAGREITEDALWEILQKDKAYYESSEGGVTFSGGEPTMQPEFLLSMMERLKGEGISIAVDTCGWCDEKTFERVLDGADLILFDLKHMDPTEHKKLTGQSNEIILQNFVRTIQRRKNLQVRYPMIPGLNDGYENIEQMCVFLKKWGVMDLDVSVYHSYGQSKYESLGKPYDPIREYEATQKQERFRWMEKLGIHAHEI